MLQTGTTQNLSFDALVAMQASAIAELNRFKWDIMQKSHPKAELDAVKKVEGAWGKDHAMEVMNALFYAPSREFPSSPGAYFLNQAEQILHPEIVDALKGQVSDSVAEAQKSVLDRIASSGNSLAISIIAATVLGMDRNVNFEDRPIRLRKAKEDSADPVGDVMETYGAKELAEKEPAPEGMVLMQISAGDQTRFFAISSVDLGRQAIMSIAYSGNSEMVLANFVK